MEFPKKIFSSKKVPVLRTGAYRHKKPWFYYVSESNGYSTWTARQSEPIDGVCYLSDENDRLVNTRRPKLPYITINVIMILIISLSWICTTIRVEFLRFNYSNQALLKTNYMQGAINPGWLIVAM